ncbi:MAG: hypothetical protein IMW92_10255 [Bacillales bacterium]|nr:hypothetical protein [Bacillales bacterium]
MKIASEAMMEIQYIRNQYEFENVLENIPLSIQKSFYPKDIGTTFTVHQLVSIKDRESWRKMIQWGCNGWK